MTEHLGTTREAVSAQNPDAGDVAMRQADAYDRLLSVYQSRHDLLQPIRNVVLDRVLTGLQRSSTVLEIGCGAGACLALMAERGFVVEGIDLSPDMAEAARARSGCFITHADFQTHVFGHSFDLLFAQAFVHLFPKNRLVSIIQRFKTLARKRIYFSTSLAATPSEGWQEKDGVERFRSYYTAHEFEQMLVRMAVDDPDWAVSTFELVDPLSKRWVNVILDRC